MGCCGCTLQTSAIVAAVFGIIQSVVGFITGIIVLTALNSYRLTTYGTVVANVLISATIFNALWLLASIVLIIGIVKGNAVMHRIWVGATSVIMIADLVHSILFVIAFVNEISSNINSLSYNQYKDQYYFDSQSIFIVALLMTAVSRGSIWLWIVNICLTIYTAHRANEIERGPIFTGQTVIVYGDQPVHPYAMPGQPVHPYAMPGQTVIVHHGGTNMGMAPPYQQTQYGQAMGNPYTPDTGLPAKY